MALQGISHTDDRLERVDILGIVLCKNSVRYGIRVGQRGTTHSKELQECKSPDIET